MNDLELAYVHDGSLEGLLTAVFLAFERKEYPSDVSASRSFVETRARATLHGVSNEGKNR